MVPCYICVNTKGDLLKAIVAVMGVSSGCHARNRSFKVDKTTNAWNGL